MKPELEQPESYWYWLRAAGRMAIPQYRDWVGVGYDVWEALRGVGMALSATALRLLILATSPVSIPLLALVALRANTRAAAARNEERKRVMDALCVLTQKEPQ